ncbi:KRUF family protein, partial [Toxoplasma gondii TgCatPRC2]
MVTRLAVVGTALAACICCFEQDVESPLIISWLPTAWVFTRHLRAAAVVFLRFTDSVLRARAAHVPGDDHSDKRGSPYHATAGSESEEETRVSPEAPAQAPSSSAPESADSRSHRHGATDAPSGSTAAGLGCSEADQFGVASTVNLAGLGDVTYGVVALQQLRRQATALRQEWTNENTFVKMSVGRRCVDQPALPTVEQIRRWSTLSRKRFRARFPTRLREADHLETLANDVVKALENAGVSVPHDAEHSSSQPGTDDQTLTSGGDASGAAGGDTTSAATVKDYIMLGIQSLRNQAAALKEVWMNKEMYVARQVAQRLVRGISPTPPRKLVTEWKHQARREFCQRAHKRIGDAAALEAKANVWENKLATGAQTDIDAAGVVHQQDGQKKQRGVEVPSTTLPGDPSVSSASPGSSRSRSLVGTVLASTVELEGRGKVSYVQLAIEALSRRVAKLKSTWACRDTYVALQIAARMLRGNNRSPSAVELTQWCQAARDTFRRNSSTRKHQAADLLVKVDELKQRAVEAGVTLESSQEHIVEESELDRSLTASQDEGSSAGRPPPSTPVEAQMTFAHLAITSLRREAKEIRELWCRGEDSFVAQHVAERLVREDNPSPTPQAYKHMSYEARSMFRRAFAWHQQKASELEAQALTLEQELHHLLPSTQGHEEEPPPVAESSGKSSESPKSGKRKAKTKHLSQTPSASAGEGTSSAGEGTSSAGAASMPRSLWLTPVVALPLRAPRQGPWWPGAEAPVAGRQVSPTAEPQPKRARRSRETSGRSPPTASGPSVGTGGQ